MVCLIRHRTYKTIGFYAPFAPILTLLLGKCIWLISMLLKCETSICLLLLRSMLWHKEAIFESKGDNLSSCWMQHSNRISIRLNACWQNYWDIEDQAKSVNSIARPYDQLYNMLDAFEIGCNWHILNLIAPTQFIASSCFRYRSLSVPFSMNISQ